MSLCKYGDPLCPCQDGDMCHYEGPNPMTVLDKIAGIVLAYRPKSKQPKPRKRKKAKRATTSPH